MRPYGRVNHARRAWLCSGASQPEIPIATMDGRDSDLVSRRQLSWPHDVRRNLIVVGLRVFASAALVAEALARPSGGDFQAVGLGSVAYGLVTLPNPFTRATAAKAREGARRVPKRNVSVPNVPNRRAAAQCRLLSAYGIREYIEAVSTGRASWPQGRRAHGPAGRAANEGRARSLSSCAPIG